MAISEKKIPQSNSATTRKTVQCRWHWILLLLLGLCLVAFYFAERSNIDAACKQQLTLLIEQKRKQLEALVEGQVSLTMMMAQSTVTRNYLLNPIEADSEMRAAAVEEMRNFSNNFLSRRIFWVVGQDRILHFIFNNELSSFNLNPNLMENYWYNATLLSPTKYNINFNYNNEARATCLWVNVPVRSSQNVDEVPTSFIGCGIDLRDMVAELFSDLPANVELVFFNRQRDITVASDFSLHQEGSPVLKKLDEWSPAVGQVAAQYFPNLLAPYPQSIILPVDNNGESNSLPDLMPVRVNDHNFLSIGYIPELNWFVAGKVKRTFLMVAESQFAVFSLLPVGILLAALLAATFFACKVITQNARLTQSNQWAVTASNAKSRFLALVSHELRTPINVISGMTEFILQESVSVKVRDYTNKISTSSNNLLALITNLIDHSRLERGELEITPLSYSLRSMLMEVFAISRVKIGDRPLMFTIDVDPNCPDKLYGDLSRVRQVLVTLLGNAVKHTEKGGINFRLTHRYDPGDKIVELLITISDTGKGMKKEQLKNVFAGLRKYDVIASGVDGESVGVDLEVAYNVVRAMNGEIIVKSEHERGTAFTLKIPQVVEDSAPLAEVTEQLGKNVLLIESRKPYATAIMTALRELKIPCWRAAEMSAVSRLLQDYVVPTLSATTTGVEPTPPPFSHILIAAGMFDDAIRLLDNHHKNSRKDVPVLLTSPCVIAQLVAENSAIADANRQNLQHHAVSLKTSFPSRLINVELPLWSVNLTELLNNDYSVTLAEQLQSNWIAPEARVLVVDDLEVNLVAMEGLLGRYKIDTVTCMNSKEALELASQAVKAQKPFHLVFIDHMMPEMNGIECTTLLHEIDKNLAIVALTANNDDEVRLAFLSQGACGFLTKPINFTTVNQCLLTRIPRSLIVRQDDI